MRADLPLPQVTSPPFPTLAQVNAGGVWAPNTATYAPPGFVSLYLTAWSCLRVSFSGTVPATVVVNAKDNTFALSRNQVSGAYVAGAVNTGYMNAIGCSQNGATLAALLTGTTYPNAATQTLISQTRPSP